MGRRPRFPGGPFRVAVGGSGPDAPRYGFDRAQAGPFAAPSRWRFRSGRRFENQGARRRRSLADASHNRVWGEPDNFSWYPAVFRVYFNRILGRMDNMAGQLATASRETVT